MIGATPILRRSSALVQFELVESISGTTLGLGAVIFVVGLVIGIYVQRHIGKRTELSTVENVLDEAFLSLDEGPQSSAIRDQLGNESKQKPMDAVLEEKSLQGKVEVMVNFVKASPRSSVSTESGLPGNPDVDETNLGNLAEHFQSRAPDESPIATLFSEIAGYDGSEAARGRLNEACDDVVEFAETARTCFEREETMEYVAQRLQDTHRALYGEANEDQRQAIDRIARGAEDGAIGFPVAPKAADIAESNVAVENEMALELLSTLEDERDADTVAQALIKAVREMDRANRLRTFIEKTYEEVYGTTEEEPDKMAERLASDTKKGMIGKRGFEEVVDSLRDRRSISTPTITNLLDALGSEAPDQEALQSSLAETIQTVDQYRRFDNELEAVSSERELRSQASKLQTDKLDADTERVLRKRIDDLMHTLDDNTGPDRLIRYEVESNLNLVQELIDDLLERQVIEESDIGQRKKGLSSAIAEVEEEYLNNPNYADYNHIIPEHFLRLVETFVENASQQERLGQENIARGYVEAGYEVLDRTETLYSTREYSELLRTLDRRMTECPNCGHHLYG
jgi:hypothetical protein